MKQKNKKEKKVSSAILLILLIISVIILGYLLKQEMQNEISIRNMEKELDKFVSHTPSTAKETSDEYEFDWNGLLSANGDVIGWIRFDEPSQINYPILQGDDNQTYLKCDLYGRYQTAGSIFLHKSNEPEFKDANSVIYGHRMMNGSMFGSLKAYASQEFMNNNPYFYIYTPDGKKRIYEIFVYAEVIDGSNVYSIQFETAEERNAYYENILSHAITKREIELDEFDTTVTLSTCARQGYYNRMVLLGKLISIELNQQPDNENKKEN